MSSTEPVPEDVEVLEGGNVAESVLRVGATVRKPWLPCSPTVTELLRHLNRHGYPAAPIAHGRSPEGSQCLEYVPGTLADRMPPASTAGLRRVGALIRRLHDLTVDFRPSGEAVWGSVFPAEEDEVICHYDLAPWNLVVGDEDTEDSESAEPRWCFIDWDGAAPVPGWAIWATRPTVSRLCTREATPTPTADVCWRWPTGTAVTSNSVRGCPVRRCTGCAPCSNSWRREHGAAHNPGPGCTPKDTPTIGDRPPSTSNATRTCGRGCSPLPDHDRPFSRSGSRRRRRRWGDRETSPTWAWPPPSPRPPRLPPVPPVATRRPGRRARGRRCGGRAW